MGRYRTRRAVNTVGYTTLTVVGGAAFATGVLFEIGGSALTLSLGSSPLDNPAIGWGAVFTAASGAVVSAGIYGVVVGRRQLDDPRRWYRDETLRSLVDGWNAGEDPRWILDSLTVSVVPGGVLVSGAF